jgi:hypothetical protein
VPVLVPSREFLRLLWNSKFSLRFSQEPVIDLYRETDEFIPHHHTLFLQNLF